MQDPNKWPIPKGRAATPEQKRDVIERLYAAWLKEPEQRLGQLIENSRLVMKVSPDLFAQEDEHLVSTVEAWVASMEPPKDL